MSTRPVIPSYQGLIGAFLLLASTSFADYLPRIGPGPLRFQTLPLVSTNSGPILPIVPETQPAINTISNATVAEGISPGVAAEPVVTTVKSPGLEETNDFTKELMPWFNIGESSFIAPQMIMPFFRPKPGETNALEPGLVAPVIFVAPISPFRPLSSKAKYSTP